MAFTEAGDFDAQSLNQLRRPAALLSPDLMPATPLWAGSPILVLALILTVMLIRTRMRIAYTDTYTYVRTCMPATPQRLGSSILVLRLLYK